MTELVYPKDLGEGSINSTLRFTQFQRDMIFSSMPVGTISLYTPDAINNPNTILWDEGSLLEMGTELASNLAGQRKDYHEKKMASADKALSDFQSGLRRPDEVLTGTQQAQQANMQYSIDKAKKAQQQFNKNLKKAQGVGEFLKSDTLGYGTKSIPNPFTVMIFKGVNLREFNFTFRFYPLSQDDVSIILQIISSFSSGALPPYELGGAELGYPNEYEIEFLFNGEQNIFLPIFKRCVLQHVNVNYTEQGFWAMSRDGAPLMIQLELGFKEIEILTRESYNFVQNEADNFLSKFNANLNDGTYTNAIKNTASTLYDTVSNIFN